MHGKCVFFLQDATKYTILPLVIKWKKKTSRYLNNVYLHPECLISAEMHHVERDVKRNDRKYENHKKCHYTFQVEMA